MIERSPKLSSNGQRGSGELRGGIACAFVFVHGILRDADSHFRAALAAAFLAGALDDTVIVAPRFASNSSVPGNEAGGCRDTLAQNEASWICESQKPDTWRSGGAAVNGGKLSSFDFMDEILRRLARKEILPNLKSIVVAGHSAGGQFVIRYEMLNQVHDKLGIPISYVVANPSSYAYVDSLRPTTSAFSGPLPATMPGAPASGSAGPSVLTLRRREKLYWLRHLAVRIKRTPKLLLHAE